MVVYRFVFSRTENKSQKNLFTVKQISRSVLRFEENWRTDSLEVDIKTNKYFMFVLYRERQQAKNGTRTSASDDDSERVTQETQKALSLR
jgi:hypothetical protein